METLRTPEKVDQWPGARKGKRAVAGARLFYVHDPGRKSAKRFEVEVLQAHIVRQRAARRSL